MRPPDNRERGLSSSLRDILLLPLGIWGALTVLTHAAQLTGITFAAYAACAIALAAAVAVACFIKVGRAVFSVGTKDLRPLLQIAGVCLIGSALALLINHPADDDYFYLPNAVYYLQHPSSPMGFDIHFLFSGGQSFTSIFWATSGAYEYIQAVAARTVGSSLPAIHYVVVTAAVGFMIPFSILLLLNHFSDGTPSAAVGTLIAVGGITLLGDTPRTFGSHSLAHPFQGIIVVLAIVLPLFASYTLDYFANPGARSWIGIFLLATAGVGASASAVFLLPALGLTLAAAHLIAGPERFQVLRRLPAYLAGMAYLFLYGSFIWIHGATDLDAGSPANYGWPQDFVGHLQFHINPAMPTTAIAWVVTTLLAILLLRGHPKRLLAAWIVSAFALFLNPLVAPFIIRFATSPNAYWRMFYILPFPLTIGIAGSALHSRLGRVPAIVRQLIVVVSCALLAAANLVLTEASIVAGREVELGLTRYKLPSALVQAAQDVIAIAPHGPMLAPSLLGGTVVLLDSDYPQVRIKKDPLRAWLYARGEIEDAEARIKASDFLDARPNGEFDALVVVIERHPAIRSIVARRPVYADDAVRALFDHHGFTANQEIKGYVVVWKTP
jgi:hypothetical protein